MGKAYGERRLPKWLNSLPTMHKSTFRKILHRRPDAFIIRQPLWLEWWHLGQYVGRLETTGICRAPADFHPTCTSPPACSSPWPCWLVRSPVHLSPLVNTGAMLPIRCHCHHNPSCWGHREEFSPHPGELFHFLLCFFPLLLSSSD